MQIFVFTGRLGREPEMRYTPSGQAVTDFSIALNEKVGEEKKTMWVRVSCWGKLAEVCNQYLHKGRRVQILGKLNFDPESGNPKVFNRKDGSAGSAFEVTANQVEFLDDASGTGNGEAPADGAAPAEEEIHF